VQRHVEQVRKARIAAAAPPRTRAPASAASGWGRATAAAAAPGRLRP
jgi:hypothetical protein